MVACVDKGFKFIHKIKINAELGAFTYWLSLFMQSYCIHIRMFKMRLFSDSFSFYVHTYYVHMLTLLRETQLLQ